MQVQELKNLVSARSRSVTAEETRKIYIKNQPHKKAGDTFLKKKEHNNQLLTTKLKRRTR